MNPLTTVCCLLFFFGNSIQIPVQESSSRVLAFLRDAVERPPDRFRSAGPWNSAYQEVEDFGTRSLPLRSAVEQEPDKLTSRLPLRDAVERRPPPDEPFDPLFDTLEDVEIIDVVPQELLSTYRIGNPYQEIISFRNGRSQRDVTTAVPSTTEEPTEETKKHALLMVLSIINDFYPGVVNINTTEKELQKIFEKIFLGEITPPPKLLVPLDLDAWKKNTKSEGTTESMKSTIKNSIEDVLNSRTERRRKRKNQSTTTAPTTSTETTEEDKKFTLGLVLSVINSFYPGVVTANTTEEELKEIMEKVFAGEITSPPELLVPLDLDSWKNTSPKESTTESMQSSNRKSSSKNGKSLRFQQANENLREKFQTDFDHKSDPTRTQPRLVCFLDGSAVYRDEPFAFHAKDLDARTCTHVIYAFATVDPHQYTITPQDYEYDVIKGGYRSVTGLKRLNPHLKVLISIGEAKEEGSHKYSDLVTTASRRREFIRSVIRFLDEYEFDGVDLHWQYPGAEELGGRSSDKANFNLLLEELSEIFHSREWLLSVSVPASRFRIEDGYDAKNLAATADFVNLHSFDFHSEKEPVADHHAPLTRRNKDNGLNVFYNVDYAVRYWLKKGLPRQKLNLGVGFHARTFTLRWGNSTSPGADIRGPAPPGPYTHQQGMLSYYEMCDAIITEGWTQEVDEIGSPFAHNGAQWAGYETPESVKKKVLYVQDVGLGGMSVWAVDLDDFRGVCGEKYPLLNAVKQSLYNNGENSLTVDEQSSALCTNGDGLFSSATNCNTYTVCRSGIAYHMQCPGQQMYDAVSGKCGYIKAEQCHPGKMVRINASPFQLSEIFRAAQKSTPKVVCYVTNWAFYRKAEGRFVPEHLDTRLCTHVVFAFASLDPEKLILQESDPWADLDNNLYSRVTSVTDVPVLLALGGWTDSHGDKYSKLVSDGSARRRFVSSAVSFLRKYNFKGLHLDWNYPVCWQSNCQKGPASDKVNFAKLVQELRAEFDKQDPTLILAASISGYKEVINVAYDLPVLGQALDFMSVMTYDYHGHWERKTGHVSPLYQKEDDTYPQYNSNYTMELLVSKGAPRSKLLLGVPFYGQSFTLSKKGSDRLGAISTGPGEPGEYTKQPGMLAYYEICNRVRSQSWKTNKDSSRSSGSFASHGDQWVGYDDVDSMREKARYVINNSFGGISAWTVDLDDFSNRCCLESFPLLRALNRGLGRLKDAPPSGNDCTKPPEPVTPPAPVLTTAADSGAASTTTTMSSSTWPSWSSTTRKPTPSTEKTTTIWWKPSSESTTPSSWWSSSTTNKPSTTTPAWWTSTKGSSTSNRPPTTTMSWWSSTSGRPSTTTSKTTTASSWQSTTTAASEVDGRPPTTTMSWWSSTSGRPVTTTSKITTASSWLSTTSTSEVDGRSCEPGTYAPDTKCCTSYYRCILGELKRQKCASGLHWNSRRNLCDWPADAKCVEEKIPGHRPSTTTTARTTTTSIPSTTSTTPKTSTTSTPEVTTAASTSCTNGQYYPHAQCNMFYICVNNLLVQQTCGPGLQWSTQQNSCDWSFKINCASKNRLQKINVRHYLKLSRHSECEAGSYTELNGDCSQYMMCLWGKYETFNCANGLHWNNEKHICDWPSNAKCDPSASSKPPSGSSPPHKPPSKPSTTTSTTLRPSTTTETPEPLSGYYKIVCYFTNWAWYRRGLGKYTPDNIDPNLCTHIVYGFAVLDYENLVVKAHDSWADFDNKFYERVVAYKAKGLKVTLALGGWNDSAGDKYSRLVNNPSARARFIKHVLEFLEKYNFDGLDLDWEYPKCWQVDCKKGPDSDKPAFAAFIKELSEAFRPRGLLLSAAVSPSKTVIDAGYDVPALAKYLDWVAVMTYDFHGQWDKKTGHVAPLYLHPDDDVTFFNANFSINYWISEGVPRRNIVMGMPLYGQSFSLERASNNGLNAKAPGPGSAGEFTRAAGFLAYYEICNKVLNHGWKVIQDPEHRMGPYAYKDNQWVSFDDVAMIRRKSRYIRDMDLGGGMVWALDLDDFRNRCGEGVHPLMNAIRQELRAEGTGITSAPPTAKPVSTKIPLPTDKPTSKPSKPSYIPSVITTMKPLPSTTTIGTPSMDSKYKMVCYFTNWAWYRQGGGKYLPSDIDPDLCTHIVYGFAVLNGDQLVIKPHDSWADFDNKFYEKVTAFKAKGIKVLIAIGGWNDSAGDKYSRLVNSPSARRKFIAHVMDFIEKNDFDGLDLDWEYPKCWQVDCNKGPSSDKPAFSEFVKELSEAFRPKGWLLSAAVSPAKKVVDAGYDVPALSKYLDWIAVMCYDYHGQWDKITGHVAPMYVHPEDVDVTFNTNYTIHYWISQGAERSKLVLGMPLYGQSFSLADNSINGLNSATYGGGEAGDSTRARGFLSYYEICQNVQKRGWQVIRDRKGRMGPYAFLRDQWVSFDDISMLQHKSEYIKAMGLGGGMVWALDLDDFKDYCGCEKYPLLKAINRVLRGYPTPQPSCILDSKPRIQPSKPPKTNTIQPVEPVQPVQPTQPHKQPCDGQLYSADETDCKKYYLCNQGSLLSQTCPNGLFWNKDHCDWPENTKCHPDGSNTVTEEPVVATEKPPVVQKPLKPVSPGTSSVKVVCYFTNWAWYRQGDGKYKPEDIDADLCTHITYGFAVLDSNSLTIKPHDSWADIDNDFYGKVTALRQKGIKVLIAIGGWNDSLGDKYSRLVNSPSARQKFIAHVVHFIEKWGFDGLDLDWEYPKCWQVDCTKGPDSDKQGFAALVKELSQVLKPKGLLLSSAVSPSKTVIDAGYDVPTLAEHFDWIAVMTYDFHGHWDKKTGHVAPLYYYPNDTFDYFNANFSLHYWLEKGTPPQKLIMGLPLYGQSFSLADSGNRDLNSTSYGPGEAGEFTRAGGFLAFYEICERVKRRSWTVTRDPEGRIGPYATHGNQWVSYDDVSEVKRKSRLIKQLNLGGGMIWALDLDDFRNRCGCGHHPLLRVLNQELRGGNFNARSTDCT